MPLERTDDIPDTLQWWFGESGCWRIRTYALDHDVHAFKIGNSIHTTLELAKKNNQDNYGDVIAAQHLWIAPLGESRKLNSGASV
jgi:hypothetical protein